MKVKLTIPTSLKDIKLSQYQKFLRNTKDSEDVNYINTQLISCFCNIEDKLVKAIAKRDYDQLLKDISEILKREEEAVLHRIIKVDGVTYGFIPKLDDITVGEQSDLDDMINDWSKMDKVMSILYRPVTVRKGDKYQIEEYKDVGSLDLTMDIVNGALVFFYNLLNDLLNSIQNYIQHQVITDKRLQSLEVNGVGINQSMDLLKVTFSDFKKLLNYDYMKHYSL